MWIVFAFGAAFFAGITSILVKAGVRNINSNLATAIRTIIVLLFSWLMVYITGSYKTADLLGIRSIFFLLFSGLATGGAWLCYFKALQIGDINKVVPIDKSSVVLTMILAFVFLGEEISWFSIIAIVCITIGTYLMVSMKNDQKDNHRKQGLIYAMFSAVFASLQAILAKVGLVGIESNLGTAIRTIVVLFMAWIIVIVQGKQNEIKRIDKKSWIFLILSGLATGISWLCYYRAIQEGKASVVVPIDKLSILITVFLSGFIFKEQITKKSYIGLGFIVIGTMCLLVRM